MHAYKRPNTAADMSINTMGLLDIRSAHHGPHNALQGYSPFPYSEGREFGLTCCIKRETLLKEVYMENIFLTRERSLKNAQRSVASIANFKPSNDSHWNGESSRFTGRTKSRWRLSVVGLQATK